MKEKLDWKIESFTNEEKELIKGTIDFISLSHYTTNYAKWIGDEDVHFYMNDLG